MRKTNFPNKKLLVEGNHDRHTVFALRERYHITKEFEVIDCKGFENVIEQIKYIPDEEEIQRFGLIVDADQNINACWDRLSYAFKSQYNIILDNISINGLIQEVEINKKALRIGIWIMPNNQDSGMLEDFLKMLIDEQDALLPIAENSIAEIKNKGLQKWSDIHDAKALIYTWLAWQEDPGKPYGQAVTAKYFKDEALAQIFIDWLKRLFDS